MTPTPLIDTLPVAPLKIIAMENCKELGEKIDQLIVDARQQLLSGNPSIFAPAGYTSDSFLVNYRCDRFSTGEAKATILESIRGKDLYILSDITNHSICYPINGNSRMMAADEHFQDLKRIIAACSGMAHRIHVIMPFLYEGRQNVRDKLESLDCAVALQELETMGISNLITFDAHEPRVQNAIPIDEFDNYHTSYQFIKSIMQTAPDLHIDSNHLMIISPDEGGMSRAVYYSNILGLDMGMFFKRRDYTTNINGENPILSIEFLGNQLEGKDAILIDDMIATGRTSLEAARELKRRNARKVYIAATYGLFTHGLDVFDRAYEEGVFDQLYTTNLSYCSPELLSKPYYHNVDVSRYIALIIDRLNNDISTNEIQDASARIQELLKNR